MACVMLNVKSALARLETARAVARIEKRMVMVVVMG
jgi:hypothetical protein